MQSYFGGRVAASAETFANPRRWFYIWRKKYDKVVERQMPTVATNRISIPDEEFEEIRRKGDRNRNRRILHSILEGIKFSTADSRRRVFLSNVSRALTEKQVKREISKHGPIAKLEFLGVDEETGERSDKAVATMQHHKDIFPVIDKLNGRVWRRHRIRAREDYHGIRKNSPKGLILYDVHSLVTSEMLAEFAGHLGGTIVGVRMYKSIGNQCMGYAVIEYSKFVEAHEAVEKLDGSFLVNKMISAELVTQNEKLEFNSIEDPKDSAHDSTGSNQATRESLSTGMVDGSPGPDTRSSEAAGTAAKT